MKYWDRKEKLFKYIDGVRQFFPLAKEQLDTISRLIEKFNSNINTFLDFCLLTWFCHIDLILNYVFMS